MLLIRFLLELLRIAVLFLLLGALMSSAARWGYASLGVDLEQSGSAWLVWLAIGLLILGLYRSRLLASGWYPVKGTDRLSPARTRILAAAAAGLLVAAFWLG
ncbi:hypothetical protein MJA45_27355 [Paenibacillus aurantius]|uniref:Uncharacterized protein n=1 Tax=Paenibacillus aurantius TaxID=2918900 RepID=A0AA96LCM1_9BACL|nr:hypothetical protein [Paenibacillus aurantius]WNQ11272.1 hypothetical protein MJA45_27355 [Paenibacillus aurantius]